MQLPASMSKAGVVQMLYKSPENQAYFEMDTWGKPGALGWNQGMRWGSVLMFLDLGAAIDAVRKDIAYPFMILHDPADEITDICGSRQLVEESMTNPELKQLIEVVFCVSPFLTFRAPYSSWLLYYRFNSLYFKCIFYGLLGTRLSARHFGQRNGQSMRIFC